MIELLTHAGQGLVYLSSDNSKSCMLCVNRTAGSCVCMCVWLAGVMVLLCGFNKEREGHLLGVDRSSAFGGWELG